MAGHPLAENQKFVEPQRLADLGAGLPADHDRLDLGQLPFEQIRVIVIENLADDGPENGVAEKLQPLVRRQPMLGPRGVRYGRQQERNIAKTVVNVVPGNARAWRLICVRSVSTMSLMRSHNTTEDEARIQGLRCTT